MNNIYWTQDFLKSVGTRNNSKLRRVKNALTRLLENSSEGNANEYLLSQRMKQFKGISDSIRNCVRKFYTSRGDRVLCAFGKYLKMCAYDPNAIVLLYYSNHDCQVDYAQALTLDKLWNMPVEKSSIVLGPNENTDIDDENNIKWGELSNEELKIAENLIDHYNESSFCKAYCLPDDRILDNESIEEIQRSNCDVRLTEEQKDILEEILDVDSMLPTLLLGGAGTGKTLLAVHAAKSFAERSYDPKCKVGYFVQSDELVKRASDLCSYISKVDETSSDPEFYNINLFCGHLLGWFEDCKTDASIKKRLRDRLLCTDEFVRDFPEFCRSRGIEYKLRSQKLKIQDINWYSVWTEIRGVIKGQMTEAWYRQLPKTLQELKMISQKSIEILLENGIIKYDPFETNKVISTKGLYSIDVLNNLYEKYKDELRKSELEQLKEDIQRLLDIFLRVMPEAEDIRKEYYLEDAGCDERYRSTIGDVGKRRLYWEIYNDYYRDYLRSIDKIDENDLMRELIGKHVDKIKECYDYIVVDEVQDYTEMQLYILFRMCKRKECILFAGDGNQNVNPTVFREDHFLPLYSQYVCKLQEVRMNMPVPDIKGIIRIKRLVKNYRCPQAVCDMANDLAALRRTYAGKQGEELEKNIESIITDGPKPVRLRYTQENIKKIFEHFSDKVMYVILTYDDQKKNDLLSLFGDCDGKLTVLTVAEAKGMEYQYVVCYEMIDVFSEIIKNNKKMKSRGYENYGIRLFFNRLNVAITRTIAAICFIDASGDMEIEDKLGLTLVDNYDIDELHLDVLSNTYEDIIQDALQNEQNGKYDVAIKRYEKAGADIATIARCKTRMYIKNREFDTAFLYSIIAKDSELQEECLVELPPESPRLFLKELLCEDVDYSSDMLEKTNYKSLSEYIDNELKSLDPQEKLWFTSRFIDKVLQVTKRENENLERMVLSND